MVLIRADPRLVLPEAFHQRIQLLTKIIADVDKLDTSSGWRRSFHHSCLIADCASQSNCPGALRSPLEINLLPCGQLSLRLQKTSADADAGDAIIKIAFRPPAPVGKEVHIDARVSALFNRSHDFRCRTASGSERRLERK